MASVMTHAEAVVPRAERRGYRVDRALLGAVVALLCIGYVMVVSSSLHLGIRLFDDVMHYPIRQLIHIGLGCC